MTELQCYNKGCGAKFEPESNKEDSCHYHPGAPVFHDAYKGWSCCNKKSIDFTTFLSIKGCSVGYHNPEKPAEPEKVLKSTPEDVVVEERTNDPPPPSPLMRPDLNTSFVRVPFTIGQSLRVALEKQKEKCVEKKEVIESTEISIGESCKNSGCKATYDGVEASLGVCTYHPGYPIFHEGCKYWSCCQRKTSDFNAFLEQIGCSSGTHLWKKKNVKAASCRYDWHQTGGFVYMTIYAKSCQPDLSFVDLNPIRLMCCIVFGQDSEFKVDLELDGIIAPSESTIAASATKVEVKMKKAEAATWARLHKEVKPPTEKIANKIEKDAFNNDVDLSSIDLSDL